jgi:hypothetical protein
MRERVDGEAFYIESRNSWPFVCHVCGEKTTVSIVDIETRMKLPYCEQCGVVPEDGWKRWETRAKNANRFEDKGECETPDSIDLFADEVLSLKKEGFTPSFATKIGVSYYRKYIKKIVDFDDSDIEDMQYCHPTVEQLLDLNDLILTFWEKDLSKRPPIYEILFAALLYEARLVELLTETLQEKILDIIEKLPEEAVSSTRSKVSYEARAGALGFSFDDRALKTYWKTHAWINRHVASLLTQCGMVTQAKQLDKLGKRFEIIL